MPDVPVGGRALRTQVPDGIFTLAVELDDSQAPAEHAAFADRCQSLLLRVADDDLARADRIRADVIGQLGALRQTVAASGLGYLGALAGEHDRRPALIVLGIAATPMEFPDGIDPASLLVGCSAAGIPARR